MIAASTHLHYAYVCTALKRGVDVFWDKPMATDYETACAITSCAEKAERKREAHGLPAIPRYCSS